MLEKALCCLCLAIGICALPAADATAATEKKTTRLAIRAAEDGFDPARVSDRYSVGILENIFETLITYDWLARPMRLVPMLAEAVPVPEENGTRYTFRIKPGILFAPDAAFGGKPRELIAADMEYTIKRFRDPVNRSPYEWLFEDIIVGLDELAVDAKKTGRFNYAAKIDGIRVDGRYTISFKLKKPDYNFLYFLAMPNVCAVAREVIEKYASDTHAHPVGTGPFVLAQWIRRSKIVLERNPNYRGHTLNTEFADPNSEWDRDAIKYLGGKTLPLVDRIEITPIEEEQPRYLAFLNREHDWMDETPLQFVSQVLPNGKPSAEMQKRGVRAFHDPQLEITYDVFNVEDPVIGGLTPEKIALRRAMVLGHDRNAEIAIIRRGNALPANTPVPAGVVGHDPTFISLEQEYDPARARALLDMYGYKDADGDGYRELPNGKPLVVKYKYQSQADDNRQMAFLWVKSMAAIGIRMEVLPVQFVDLIKDRRVGTFQMAGSAWIADYPDAQNFLQLLYGPNTDQSNEARYRNPAYDALYTKSVALPPGAARDAVYREMYRNIMVNAPWRLATHRVFNHMIYPWVKGYKKHPILYTSFRYLDIDSAERKRVAGW